MKKLISLALALFMVLSMIPASAETAYTEAPYWAGKGLPAVAERMPVEPMVEDADYLTIGTYGGELRRAADGGNWYKATGLDKLLDAGAEGFIYVNMGKMAAWGIMCAVFSLLVTGLIWLVNHIINMVKYGEDFAAHDERPFAGFEIRSFGNIVKTVVLAALLVGIFYGAVNLIWKTTTVQHQVWVFGPRVFDPIRIASMAKYIPFFAIYYVTMAALAQGYRVKDLPEWATTANIRAYKVVDGQLVYDSANGLIAELKKGTKGNEELQGKITGYETQVADLQKQLAETKIKAAVKVALLSEKATDIDYLTFKLEEKLRAEGKILELDDNENIKGWDDLLSGLKTQLPNQFAASNNRIIDPNRLEKPNEKPTLTKDEFNKMGYNSKVKLRAENPELYDELTKG